QRPQVCKTAFSRLVLEHVLKDPAEPGGIRTQLRFRALRKRCEYGGKVFESARARPVKIRTFFINDVDERVAEVREAAHSFHLWRTQHRGHDRICELAFYDVRTAIPPRIDDHLSVTQVRNGVERDVLHRPPAEDRRGGYRREHQESIARREI